MNNMMVKEHEMKYEIYEYIADSVNCTVEQLKSGTTCFVKNPWEGCIKILSIRDTDIISLSEDKYAIGKQLLTGKNRDELYESTLIFGQTLHYLPDLQVMNRLPLIEGFSYELYEEDTLYKLCGIKGFENSLAFDTEGTTNTNIALCARKDIEIIAVAGASAVSGKIAEVGIDVKKEWRGHGLAGLLIRNLTVELLERNMIPFYSASVTNLASQAVAIRSGYMPLWTDSYGVR